MEKVDAVQLTIKTLWGVVAILIVVNLLLLIGWMSAPSRLRVYLPPDLTQGALIKADAIPKSTVYAFVYQIFTAINTWTNNGADDYKKTFNPTKIILILDFIRNY